MTAPLAILRLLLWAWPVTLAVLLGIIYVRTQLGPLDLLIRGLMELQAGLHGLAAELAGAAIRWRRSHRRRVQELRLHYAMPLKAEIVP